MIERGCHNRQPALKLALFPRDVGIATCSKWKTAPWDLQNPSLDPCPPAKMTQAVFFKNFFRNSAISTDLVQERKGGTGGFGNKTSSTTLGVILDNLSHSQSRVCELTADLEMPLPA